MAQNSALAAAGDDTVLAQTPAPGTAPIVPSVPASGVTQPSPTPATPAAPVVVKVGTESLTVEQLAQRIAAGDAARQTLDLAQNKLAIGETFFSMTEAQRNEVLDFVEELSQGRTPVRSTQDRTPMVHPVDIPKDTPAPVTPKWSDLSETEQFLYATLVAMASDVRADLRKLSGILSGLQAHLGEIQGQSQEQQLINSLQRLGINATAETVAAMRAKGIDPARAMQDPDMLEMMRKSHAPAVTIVTSGAPPPEATPTGDANTFDARDPNLTDAQVFQLMKAGKVPANPADRERFEQLMRQHGEAMPVAAS